MALFDIHKRNVLYTESIPSEAELVAQFGFSRMTINRALRELTDEGLLVRLQGVGTFVAEPKRFTVPANIRVEVAYALPEK
ncbi:GntR family transcriptional regulator, partial [Klebsiella pneumoniae]|nr:GntR family transcriptional regulator [Klebsiella pneumoniae]